MRHILFLLLIIPFQLINSLLFIIYKTAELIFDKFDDFFNNFKDWVFK